MNEAVTVAAIRKRGPTEEEFTRQVTQYAHLCRWMVAHFRPAQTSKGWRTPVQGDGRGFPDLVMVHARRGVVFAELKTQRGKLSSYQTEWIRWLSEGRARVFLWTPADWREIEKVLRGETF